MTADGKERAWLLFDGECVFCGRAAAWVERRDRGRTMRVVAYQDAPSPPLTPALRAACAEAVHVVTPRGRALRAGDAWIYVAGALWGWGLARLLWWRPLRSLVGVGYGLVARRRACTGACALDGEPPPPDQAAPHSRR